MTVKLSQSEKNLIQRYLLWCFKTTRESLDRIERKFTQVQVDRYILRKLEKGSIRDKASQEYLNLINGFKEYIDAKEQEGMKQKYHKSSPDKLNPEYSYLQNRLKAIEKAVIFYLGPRTLANFVSQYENEMTRRILESREH